MAGPWEQFQTAEGGGAAPWEAFAGSIDKETGSPANVRLLVGSAPEGDKLANLKQFYPDAQPFGDDNFVYSNPETGRPTLHNPEGMDFGDVAGGAREITQAVFSTGGAIAGGVAGLATGPGAPAAVPVAASIGAGAGSAVGGSLFDIAANLIGGRVDTRNIAERTVDTALDFGAAAAGQRAGELVAAGAKAAAVTGKQAAQNLAAQFRSLRIEPTAGALGSRGVQTVEKALETIPSSADIMQKQAERTISQAKQAAVRVAAKFGTPKTKQGAGETIREAAKGVAERFGFRQEALYDNAFNLVGKETPVAVQSVQALRESMEQELVQAPRSLKAALEPAMRMLRAIEMDADDVTGGIPFQALRQVRTMIGKDLASPQLAGSTGAQNEALKRVYGALTEDMSAAAKTAGPEAAKKLATADRFTRAFMTTAAKTMQKIADFDADEKAFQFAMQSARDGGSGLARMRRHFLPEEWDTVAATVFNRLGQATPGAQNAAGDAFSVSSFLTNWNRLAPEAKQALFGGKRYAELVPELDNLVSVVGALKDVATLANTSNTARAMNTMLLLQAVGGAGAASLAGGDSATAGVSAVGAVVAPRVAARLITSPKFVQWLTSDVPANAIAAHVGRLSAIAIAEPEIREEIEQYVQALRSIPAVRQQKAKPE